VTAFTITGLQVRGSLEDAKLEAIADLEEQEGVRLDSDNACADAEDNHAESPGAQRVVDACDKGRSRATLTNVFIGATVVTALAASYFYYRGYVAADPAPSREGTGATAARRRRATQVRFTPAVGPEVVGAGFEIKF
jgi:hypothetical protein